MTVTDPRPQIDPVGLSWLTTVRWATVLACLGAVVAGRSTLHVQASLALSLLPVAGSAASNLWLMLQVSRSSAAVRGAAPGLLVCADVLLLSWVLMNGGGVLNPASVFYLVEIVVAALVLGRRWTWMVTALSVAGYAALFLAPTDAQIAAQGMHPEIARHLSGMWLALAFTAVIVAILVTRLAIAVERRDHALETLRERAGRAARFSGLMTLAAGAAHELSTPLATMAVAARELEHRIVSTGLDVDACRDARLIRAEIDRCRRILEGMAGRAGATAGKAPHAARLADVMVQALDRLTEVRDRDRVDLDLPTPDVTVVWPPDVVGLAVANLVQNAIHASGDRGRVQVRAEVASGDWVRLSVIDQGTGLSPEHLSRVGEPFFTTKPPGIGTGLGVFVARSSIEQLGGSLSINSIQGHGTTVALTVPVNVMATAGPIDV